MSETNKALNTCNFIKTTKSGRPRDTSSNCRTYGPSELGPQLDTGTTHKVARTLFVVKAVCGIDLDLT